MKTGAELIAEERQRQIEVEGWTPEHDDQHSAGDLASAGACYALLRSGRKHLSGVPIWQVIQDLWPWYVDGEPAWWKPKDVLRDLARSGALIAAALDREIRREQDEQSRNM